MATPPSDPNATFTQNGSTVTICVTGLFPSMNTLEQMMGFGKSPLFGPISWPSLSGGYDAMLLVGEVLLKLVKAIAKPIITIIQMAFADLLATGEAAWDALCGGALKLSDIFTKETCFSLSPSGTLRVFCHKSFM